MKCIAVTGFISEADIIVRVDDLMTVGPLKSLPSEYRDSADPKLTPDTTVIVTAYGLYPVRESVSEVAQKLQNVGIEIG